MQNIGERLEEARKRKGISIREAAEATKVRGDYLHKFESNQFDINLPDIYVRGFLRNYAGFLGLPAEKIVNDYNALGHGSPSKAKPINREIYGRMELSIASAKDADGKDEDGSDADSENPATFKPKPSTLPYVDKALLVKGGALLAAVVVLVLLVVFGIRAIQGDVVQEQPQEQSITSLTTPGDGMIAIVALQNVRVKLVDIATKEEIFQGAIPAGEHRLFRKTGSLFFTADPMENVEVEIDADPTNIAESYQLRGLQRVRID